MARPRLALGAHGQISRTQVDRNTWVAKARVRDADGVTRLVERRTPAGALDKYGAKAESALVVAVGERTRGAGNTGAGLSGESTLRQLWVVYRHHLESDGKALRTLDRYDYVGAKILLGLGGIRIREADTQRLDGFIRALATRHGPSVAKTARVLLSGMFKVASRYGAATLNPVREVSTVRSQATPSRALSVLELQLILDGMRTSQVAVPPLPGAARQLGATTVSDYCAAADLVDVITMFIATGCRISELLALRWADVDLDAPTISITGKLISVRGRGLLRESTTKTAAGQRVLPLPSFAVDVLLARSTSEGLNDFDVVFPSSTGTLRDPDGVSKQWRRVRDSLGFGWATTHTFRRTMATIIDAEGLSARVGADQLGHRDISMTQDVYMGRGLVHPEVAAALDHALGPHVQRQSVG